MSVIPATAGKINRRIVIQDSSGKKRGSTLKITRAKRVGGIAQASTKP
jgi:hypothetical protein